MHYENLKLYKSLGLAFRKNHRGIKFEESSWLEEYINLNTKLRIEAINLNTKLRIEAKQSGNNFEVDFVKLMSSSVFGKTLENIRKRVDIRLMSSDKVAKN